MLSNNTTLPPLPAWHARSFWLTLLGAIAVILNTAGLDLWSLTSGMGLGASAEEVMATGERAVSAVQQLLPIILGIWAWFERRAPKYRLVWTSGGPRVTMAAGSAALIIALAVALWAAAGPVRADEALPQCAPPARIADVLQQSFGEVPVVTASGPTGRGIVFFVSATGSWTMVMSQGDVACVVSAGEGWSMIVSGEDA